MRRLAIAATLLAAGSALAADPVSLAVDLDAEARLRLDHWPEGGWRIQQFENLVEIRFPGEELPITGLEDAAATLPTRLADISTDIRDGATYLRLSLACDCTLAMMGNPADGLALDILGGTAPTAPSAEALRAAAAIRSGPAAPLAAPVPTANPGQARPAPVAAEAAADVDVEEARARLMQQLLRAADAGLVALAPQSQAAQAREEAQAAEAERARAAAEAAALAAAEAEAQQAAEAQSASPAPDVRDDTSPEAAPDAPTTVAEDTSATSEPQVAEAPPAPAQCFPGEMLALPDIIDSDTLAARIGVAQLGLVGEFDRPQAEAALDLAKTYLAVGMGVEARAVLGEFAAEAEGAHPLRAMAALYGAGDPAEHPSLVKDDCIGAQALWRGLAHAKAGRADAALDAEAASGRSLEDLPVYPRQLVAAWIGRAATERGAWDTARRLEAMAIRAAGTKEGLLGPTLLLSARLAEWHGDVARAETLLNDALDKDPDTMAEALLMKGQRALTSEAEIGADTTALRTDLGGLASAYRGTERGWRAFELEARLLDRVAGRDETIRFLSRGVESGLYPEDRHVGLLSDLVNGPAMAELSRPLALIYLDDPERFAPALAQQAFRTALVRSMSDEGVPALARDVIRDGDLADPDLADTYARALLRSGDPRDALSVAEQMPPGPMRHSLLADALAAIGQRGQAIGHLAAAAADSTQSEAERLAFLDRKVSAALSSEDAEMALSAALEALALDPAAARAEGAALLALDAGRDDVPEEVALVLSARDPARLDALRRLFQPASAQTDSRDPKAVEGYLETLDREISMIEELLGDG